MYLCKKNMNQEKECQYGSLVQLNNLTISAIQYLYNI